MNSPSPTGTSLPGNSGHRTLSPLPQSDGKGSILPPAARELAGSPPGPACRNRWSRRTHP